MSPTATPTLEYESGPSGHVPGDRRARTIGVLLVDPSPRTRRSALSGVQRALDGPDYLVNLVAVPAVSSRPLLDAADQLHRMAVDGILVVAPHRTVDDAWTEIAGDVPLVTLAPEPREGHSVVSIDHRAAGAKATRHLLERGHRTVFHIAGPAARRDAALVTAGWRDALRAAGVLAPAPLAGDGTPARGYEVTRQLADRSDVTAIFAADDAMALGTLRALAEAGRRVPDDVSVIGVGGMVEGEFFSPPLTTVNRDIAELARLGFERLRAEVEHGGPGATHASVPAQLIVRSSTAAAG